MAEVMRPVVAAAGVSLILETALDPPPDAWSFVVILLAYPVGVSLALLIGLWLGTRTWPRRGRRLARTLLRRAATSRRKPILYLTQRPDFEAQLPRRVLEVVGFAAGVSVILPAALQLLGAPVAAIQAAAGLSTLLALWGAFILVPYWTLARLGIRRVDPVRWLVTPFGVGYAERLKLSNGALLLVAAGVTLNLAFRAGASGDEALMSALVTLTRLVASILVVSAAAVAFYARHEKEVARELEAEALLVGIVDARGLSDGDLLPRV